MPVSYKQKIKRVCLTIIQDGLKRQLLFTETQWYQSFSQVSSSNKCQLSKKPAKSCVSNHKRLRTTNGRLFQRADAKHERQQITSGCQFQRVVANFTSCCEPQVVLTQLVAGFLKVGICIDDETSEKIGTTEFLCCIHSCEADP